MSSVLVPDIVGIAVSGRSIRGVEANIGRKTVVRTGEIAIPEATFDAGRLQDADAFADALQQLWTEAGFKSKRVRLIIDGRLAVVRRTELPSVRPEKLRQAAGFDIGELLNYPIADAVFDVDEIERFERDGVQWARALVVAVQASALADLKEAVARAGLRLHATDLAAEALARTVGPTADSGDEVDEDRPTAIINFEDSTTAVVIRDASGVLFARTLNVGVGETTISVADELESALAQLSGSESDTTDSQVDAAVGVSTVVEGVRRTLSYYTAELDQRPIRNAIVVGGRGHAAGLLASLENTLGLPAMVSPSAASWPDGITIPGFELPLGAALGAARSTSRHLVLTSDRERADRTKRRQRLASVAVTVPVLGLLAFGTVGVRATTAEARADAEQAELASNTLALRVAEMGDVRIQIDAWEAADADRSVIEAQQLRLAVVVRELAEAMPVDTRLLSIRLTRVSGDDTPTGYTGPEPEGLVSISVLADDLDGVGRWIDQVNATQTIDGLWLDQSTYGPIGADAFSGAIFSVKGVITGAARPIEQREASDR